MAFIDITSSASTHSGVGVNLHMKMACSLDFSGIGTGQHHTAFRLMFFTKNKISKTF